MSNGMFLCTITVFAQTTASNDGPRQSQDGVWVA